MLRRDIEMGTPRPERRRGRAQSIEKILANAVWDSGRREQHHEPSDKHPAGQIIFAIVEE